MYVHEEANQFIKKLHEERPELTIRELAQLLDCESTHIFGVLNVPEYELKPLTARRILRAYAALLLKEKRERTSKLPEDKDKYKGTRNSFENPRPVKGEWGYM